MKRINNCLYLVFFIAAVSCHQKVPTGRTIDDVETAFRNGQLTVAIHWADSILKKGKTDSLTVIKLSSIIDMSARIRADFTLTESEIDARLTKAFSVDALKDKALWEKNNWLEYRMIDGEKRYFKRAVPNLKLILESKHSDKPGSRGLITGQLSSFRLEHSRKVIESVNSVGRPVIPVKMMVTYRLTVNADAVPDGETVRCWLPFPREVHSRQGDVNLVKTIPDSHFMAPDTLGQRSVYLEQRASKGNPVVFEIQFNYRSMAQYFDLNKMNVLKYDTTSSDFKKYTTEQYPQIVFTNGIKQLSDSIVKGFPNPVEKVKKLYYWINDHIIWTGALEYSIMPRIPEYVMANRRGDCGMQTLLFMTMARYQGIPVKWQSGWMMHPGEVNLHDWCEVYYEGVGWVPLDMSFNLQDSNNLREKEFYISGIDAYRMIVNDAIGSQLVPVKKHLRSEPFDFQRGEVEWRGGNLYFNQWDYHMEVEYPAQ
jgi:hypothetical protein